MKKLNFSQFRAILLLPFAGMLAGNFTLPALSSSRPQNLQKTPQVVAVSSVPDWARLVDIQSVNPKIKLDIRYATTNNFFKIKLYPQARCILRAGVAKKLSEVQEDLQKRGLGLKVYDCYRPLQVTKKMWEIKPDPTYVANPAYGSRHNRGAAVDVTLVDSKGKELEMPTGFDDFSPKAWRTYQGRDVSKKARENSNLLEQVMTKHGFVSLNSEWWHFDATNWNNFAILDVPFGAVPKR